jgi:two-component system NtrC family sensor kinase
VTQTEAIYKELLGSHAELERSHNQSLSQLWETYQELEKTKKQLIQSEKLASMGQLAASVAHEINNPLSVIYTYIKLIRRKIKKGSLDATDTQDFDKYLATIERETNRSGTIVKNLLDFARQTESTLRLVNINVVIEEALTLLRNQIILQNVQVKEELSPLPEIMADLSQLQQAFVNIILNGVQSMSKGGNLTISTKLNKEKNVVEVRFTDTGEGIPQENLSRIFDPFFTTKEKGTGLGLSVVYGIIKKHQGTINVESDTGKGTTFIINIPLEQRET